MLIVRALRALIGFTCGLCPHPWAQEIHLSSAPHHQFLPRLCCRSAGLQACIWLCLQSGHQTCVVGSFILDGALQCALSRVLCPALSPAAPEGSPWMDPGLGSLLAVPGAIDGPCYQQPVGPSDLYTASAASPLALGLPASGKFCARVLGLAPLCFAKVR